MNETQTTLDEALAAMRTPGRPSLSQSGSSPVVRVRVTRFVYEAIEDITKELGVDRPTWLRRALFDAVVRGLVLLETPSAETRHVGCGTLVRSTLPPQNGASMSPDDPTEPPVRYQVDGAVATITLNRPQAMNSLDTPTKELLLESVRRAAEDTSVRCVVLTGTGRAFCVGQDLREHVTNISTQSLDEVWSTVERHYAPTVRAIADMDKPVIAAVNGVAAGAGMSLALACDLRVAADTASFNTAFTAIGLSCDTGISWTLPRLVGTTKAMELLLMPRKVDAAEAVEIGLLTSVVPAAELAARAGALAAKLAQGPTRAYAAVKRSVAFAATNPLSDAVTFEATMMAWTGGSTDHRKAVESFVAKQEPTFEGS